MKTGNTKEEVGRGLVIAGAVIESFSLISIAYAMGAKNLDAAEISYLSSIVASGLFVLGIKNIFSDNTNKS